MSVVSSSSTRRGSLASLAAAGALGLLLVAFPRDVQTAPAADAQASIISLLPTTVRAAADAQAVRPFRINVPEAALVDLRRRIAATRWPDRETVTDRSQGMQLATIQALVRYWGTGYNWRKVEAKLNALPQFVTTIDGLDIQFVHVRSRHPDALPLIMTHGWPGSIFELLLAYSVRPQWSSGDDGGYLKPVQPVQGRNLVRFC